MAKTLTIKHEGVEYTLQFTRKSIETLEKRGFRIAELSDKPMSTLPAFFAGAFLANHRFVKQETIDEIFAAQKRKPELMEALAEMYNEPLQELMGEPEENSSEGNSEWVANW